MVINKKNNIWFKEINREQYAKKCTKSLIFTERFLTSSISETTKSNDIDTKKIFHLLVIGVTK